MIGLYQSVGLHIYCFAQQSLIEVSTRELYLIFCGTASKCPANNVLMKSGIDDRKHSLSWSGSESKDRVLTSLAFCVVIVPHAAGKGECSRVEPSTEPRVRLTGFCKGSKGTCTWPEVNPTSSHKWAQEPCCPHIILQVVWVPLFWLPDCQAVFWLWLTLMGFFIITLASWCK